MGAAAMSNLHSTLYNVHGHVHTTCTMDIVDYMYFGTKLAYTRRVIQKVNDSGRRNNSNSVWEACRRATMYNVHVHLHLHVHNHCRL